MGDGRRTVDRGRWRERLLRLAGGRPSTNGGMNKRMETADGIDQRSAMRGKWRRQRRQRSAPGGREPGGAAARHQVYDDCVHGDHPGRIERKAKHSVRVFTTLLTFVFLISIVFSGMTAPLPCWLLCFFFCNPLMREKYDSRPRIDKGLRFSARH
jgi:hypothetical protein